MSLALRHRAGSRLVLGTSSLSCASAAGCRAAGSRLPAQRARMAVNMTRKPFRRPLARLLHDAWQGVCREFLIVAIDFDRAFGIHAAALTLRSARAGVLADNLANADTPGFKARDIDFREAMAQAVGDADTQAVRLERTHQAHLEGDAAGMRGGLEPSYRIPTQPSVDGNTVDSQIEKAAFMDNAVRYQATLGFLDNRIQSLRRALTGE